MPIVPLLEYYIIPWGSICDRRRNGRCVQRTPEFGVLSGEPPHGLPCQKWIFVEHPEGRYAVVSADNHAWLLTHHTIAPAAPFGIYEGPITMSIAHDPPTFWQVWKVQLASHVYPGDNRFPEDVYMFLTGMELVWQKQHVPSCMGVNENVFGRPQHLLEWPVKTANQEFLDRNQSYILRPAQ
ncbi:MAG: hypothetical protein Q8P51_03050 [Ignavibacteria bacterium]|nr:hypothetical protein [Ignavibacteria bacterium]